MLAKLAYLTLCRSIQLLALLGCGHAAKDLEILVLRHQPSCAARPHDPGSNRRIGRCLPPSVVPCPGPAGRASSSNRRRCCAGIGGWSPVSGPTRTARQGDRHSTKGCRS